MVPAPPGCSAFDGLLARDPAVPGCRSARAIDTGAGQAGELSNDAGLAIRSQENFDRGRSTGPGVIVWPLPEGTRQSGAIAHLVVANQTHPVRAGCKRSHAVESVWNEPAHHLFTRRAQQSGSKPPGNRNDSIELSAREQRTVAAVTGAGRR